METKELFGIGRTYITAWAVMLFATALLFAGKIEVDMWSTMMYAGLGVGGGKSIASMFSSKKK